VGQVTRPLKKERKMTMNTGKSLKNIHLINIAPPFRSGVPDMFRPPSGLLYVGGFLNKNGFPVIVHHIQEGEIDNTIKEILFDEQILFVGFSLMTGKQVTLSAEMSYKFKAIDSNIRIVWGGIHPSLMPEECLDYEFVDFVVIGEGEATALDLACYFSGNQIMLLEQIPGISFKNNGNIVITSRRSFENNLDNYRQDWSLLDIKKYVRNIKGDKIISFITSRGCPHNCGFCYNQAFNYRKWRSHSVEVILNELIKIKELTEINTVAFDDDNFFTNRKRAIEIITKLKQNGIKCQWINLRVDDIKKDIISELNDLGVESIFMGWESGSENTLNKIAKGFTPQLILEKTLILSKFRKIIVDASAIVGFPWEKEKDMDETVSLALKMFIVNPFRLSFNIGIYIPFPGTPIISEAEEKGFKFPKDYRGWEKFDALDGNMELPWLSNKQIRKYTVIDRYAKLLMVYPKTKLILKPPRYIMAFMAYIRLRTKIFIFPFELWITNIYEKFMLKRYREAQG
jgi:radical SAM superfamily enzyme YgiQ (UPF0313 family)